MRILWPIGFISVIFSLKKWEITNNFEMFVYSAEKKLRLWILDSGGLFARL